MQKLIAALPAESELAGVLAHRPELQVRYRAFMKSVRGDGNLPPRLLELCRVRVAQIHDCAAELALSDAAAPLTAAEKDQLAAGRLGDFSDAEQAALAIAELMPYAHHQLDDAAVKRADELLGHAGCVALLTALAFFDVNCRLKLTLGVEATAQSLSTDHLV